MVDPSACFVRILQLTSDSPTTCMALHILYMVILYMVKLGLPRMWTFPLALVGGFGCAWLYVFIDNFESTYRLMYGVEWTNQLAHSINVWAWKWKTTKPTAWQIYIDPFVACDGSLHVCTWSLFLLSHAHRCRGVAQHWSWTIDFVTRAYLYIFVPASVPWMFAQAKKKTEDTPLAIQNNETRRLLSPRQLVDRPTQMAIGV